MALAIPSTRNHSEPSVAVAATGYPVAPTKNKISWDTFLATTFKEAVNGMTSRYELEFNVFWSSHPEWQLRGDRESVKSKFVKALALYDILRANGLWGFEYEIPLVQTVNPPQALLRDIAKSASGEDGRSRPYLFTDDCDNIAFLYTEVAPYLGLSGAEVKMVSDVHVNVFVPLGKDITLRIDLTGLSDEQESPPWNLPPNTYVPKKPIQKDYNDRILEKYNRVYRQNGRVRQKQIRETSLTQETASNLIERLKKRIEHSDYVKVPKRWAGFANGYKSGKACFERYLKKYSYHTVGEATKALQDEDIRRKKRNDVEQYFSCLGEPATFNDEGFGRLMSYVYSSACFYVPSNPPEGEDFNPLMCNLKWFKTNHELHALDHRPGSTVGDHFQSEEEEVGRRLGTLMTKDPTAISYPNDRFRVESWFSWSGQLLRQDPQLLEGASVLIHLMEWHES